MSKVSLKLITKFVCTSSKHRNFSFSAVETLWRCDRASFAYKGLEAGLGYFHSRWQNSFKSANQLSNHFNVEMYDANLMRSGFLNAADSDISCRIIHGGLLCTSKNLTYTSAALLQEFEADKYSLHPFIHIRCGLSVFAYSSAVWPSFDFRHK